jgi:ech hydrogenase subunit A
MLSMFLPPFGMLFGKWIAINAIASAPIVTSLLIIFIMSLSSAATSVYYVKWLGHLTVLPNDGIKMGGEKLPLPFTLSMFGLFTLSILMGLGVSSVVGLLVLPTLPENYFAIVIGSLTSVSTSFGSFVTYPYWLTAAAILLVGTYIAKRKGGVVKAPYLGGENVEGNPVAFRSTADGEVKVEVSALFLDQEVSSNRMLQVATMVGAALMVILFVMVIT